MPSPPTPGSNPHDHPLGDNRSQVLTLLLVNLQKVPGTVAVWFEASEVEVDQKIVGELDTTIYADGIIDPADARVVINWWPQHGEGAEHWYKFHYFDGTEFACGWHRHDNDHVDGLEHYQEYRPEDDETEYWPFEPQHVNQKFL